MICSKDVAEVTSRAGYSIRFSQCVALAGVSLDSLSRSIALEWAPKGIRVDAVARDHIATGGVIED
jgi:NAD(P)-dependent dehydrogenase (short-subunit alcohol dehydrogenase family)